MAPMEKRKEKKKKEEIIWCALSLERQSENAKTVPINWSTKLLSTKKKRRVTFPVGFSKAQGKWEDGAHPLYQSIPAGPCLSDQCFKFGK